MAQGGKMTWQTVLISVVIGISFLGFIIGLTKLRIVPDAEGVRSQVMLPIHDGEVLRVETASGRIEYETWDGDQVAVEAHVRARGLTNGQVQRYTEQVQVDVARTADGVAASVKIPESLSHLTVVAADFHVRVPESWRGRVELRTTEGPVSAVGLYGDAVVETTTGPITIRSHAGSLVVRTANGAIDVDQAETVLTAHTDNGSIDVRGAVLHGAGVARTQNGSVRIRASLAETASFQVDTAAGNVTLFLDAPDVALDLASSHGRVRLHGDAVAAVEQSDQFVGRIGSGTAALKARSNNGSIEVYLVTTATL